MTQSVRMSWASQLGNFVLSGRHLNRYPSNHDSNGAVLEQRDTLQYLKAVCLKFCSRNVLPHFHLRCKGTQMFPRYVI